MHRRALLLSGLAALLTATEAVALSVYVAEDGQVSGPFDEAALKARLESRTKAAATLVWMQGMADWTPASKVPALAALVAGLPLDAPFDPAAYLVGAWVSDDHAMGSGKNAFVGKISVVFAANGSFTMQITGNRTTLKAIPAPQPGAPPMESEYLYWDISTVGTYVLRQQADGSFEVTMKGTVTDNSVNADGNALKGEEVREFRRMGPDHMQTRYGVNYRRTAS